MSSTSHSKAVKAGVHVETPMAAAASTAHSETVEAGLYAEVFGLLIALTVLTVVLSYVNVGEALGIPQFGRTANIVAGLLVALGKCSLVVWIFMHMNHETHVNRFILVFAVSLMTIFFVATSLDFLWLGTYLHGIASAAMGM